MVYLAENGSDFAWYQLPGGVTDQYVFAAEFDDDNGGVWFGTKNNGASFLDYNGTPLDQSDDVWTTYTTSNSGLSGDWVRDITRDELGGVWFGTATGGVSYLNPVTLDPGNDSFYYLTTADGLASNGVNCIELSDDERAWFGTTQGASLLEFSSNEWTTFDATDGLAGNDVRFISDDSGDEDDDDVSVWFGTSGGFSLLYEYGLVSFDEAAGLLANDVRVVGMDDAGTLWIGTYGGGICVLP